VSFSGSFGAPSLFARRHNSDGSHDSICEKCLQTVARQPSCDALFGYETAHRCVRASHKRDLLDERTTRELRAQLEAVLLNRRSREGRSR
jgi:hypothetical protein